MERFLWICRAGTAGIGCVFAGSASTLTGRFKPAPEAFRHALDGLGVDPSDAAHVGDNARTDVAGAKALGMVAVQYVGLALLVLHFVVPFLILLSQPIKRNPRTLSIMAMFIIGIRMVDVFWLVEPNFNTTSFHVSWLDFAAPLGVGGVFVALFLMELAKRPLMPLGAPDLQKTLAHGRHSH